MSPINQTQNRPALALLALCGAVLACGAPTSGTAEESDLAGNVRIRFVEGNISSGNNQSYPVPGEGMRIFTGLHGDVDLVQEFNVGGNTQAELQSFADSVCGAPCYVTRETGAQIPDGIISKYPIKASGSWTDPKVGNRGFAWAQIDIPGSKDLWAISVHLLTSSAQNRQAEATALVADIRATIPAGDYIVLGGDFNTGTRTEACIGTLSAVFTTNGSPPVNLNGNGNTSNARSKPHDWVLASPNLDALQTATVIGSHSFPTGFVADTRVYTPISDLAPALASDSSSSTMQHMAVVRDFLIPADGATDGGVRDGGAGNDGGITDGGIHDGGTGNDGGITDGGIHDGGTGNDGGITDGGTGNDGGSDGFEPDDTAASAKAITLGVPQVHSIVPAADTDWVRFTLTAATNLRVETSGPSGGDTFIRLLNAAQVELGNDDDSGAGYYSLLQKPALPAGDYFVKVTSYQGKTVIHGYSLKVSSY